MQVGVGEAAARLGVSSTRVRALIAAGVLAANRVGGRTWVVAAEDVDALADRYRAPHVRAFSPRIVWAAAALADGDPAPWLNADELSRLRSRLVALSQTTLGGEASEQARRVTSGTWSARLSQLSSTTVRARAGTRQVQGMLEDPRLRRGGASATTVPGDPLVSRGYAEVWVRAVDLDGVVDEYALLPSQSGNVVLRVASLPDLPRLGLHARGRSHDAYRLAVVTGLLEQRDARSHHAGEDLLLAVLEQRLWSRRRPSAGKASWSATAGQRQ